MRTVEEIKADIASCDGAWIDSALCRSLRCELYETILGDTPLDRLETICAAEKDGRCVALLPIEKDVYIVHDGEILEFKVYNFSLLSVNNGNVRYWAECISDENEDDLDFWQDEIGESVFLTRAEAEKALEAQK